MTALYPSRHWKARAAEALAKADQMHDDEARRVMFQVAESYERLAGYAERREADPLVTRRR
jgi:hypothetical protein